MTEELISKHLAEGIAPSEADVDQYAVDQNVSAEEAHNKLMADPVYAVATHEHQLNKISNLFDKRFNNPKKSFFKLFLNNIQQLVARLFQEQPTLYRIFHLFSPLI